MQDARMRWALAALGLLIFGGSGIALYATRRPAPPPVVITPPPAAPPAPNPWGAAAPPAPNNGGDGQSGQAQAGRTQGSPLSVSPAPSPIRKAIPAIYVHVAGAVKRPSLYALAPGSRVMQAIKAAGGPAPKADLDAINLAERVKDGEKVYVPRQQPQAAMIAPPGNVIGHASVIPGDDNPVPAPETRPEPASKAAKIAEHGGAGKPDKLTSPAQGRINLNTASAEQLQRLPGIGPAMAARILAYRAQAHGFHSIDELQEVGGIGPKKFAKIAPLVKLD
ncbi:MAG: helix-hairpin-helix domain-containing protein [Armatimonadetes bacterium]|nr:helix-hairpin-helix domain-containing protein [Armatimonadota bacterium]